MARRDIWTIEVRHAGLNKYRHIRGSSRYVVEEQANAQKLAWDEMWARKQAMDRKINERESAIKSKEEKKELATIKTKEAQEATNQLETILLQGINADISVDWEKLIDNEDYSITEPSFPKQEPIPDEPNKTDKTYQLTKGLLSKIFTKSSIKKEEEAERLFLADYEEWEAAKKQIDKQNSQLIAEYFAEIERWKSDKLMYKINQEDHNNKVYDRKRAYYNKELNAISEYCEMVLNASAYPEYFPKEWELEYNADTRLMIVDYSLPNIDSIPTIKEVKYNATKDEFIEAKISNTALFKLYDDILYNITLRTIYELFNADAINALDAIVFNGRVESIDKATGNNTNACVLSIHASKTDFMSINLEKVEAKACFKMLKGVGSSKLYGLSPIAPIISINKEDRRFISAYDIADNLNEFDNIAVMDWQDFENLIREVFEKEFARSGGEVKITQASRDGGVDAVAFDPDPIRGGKIVIQAKRYTNIVGVSAVRDLYGTTLNEGATKGILVTTADYGPDAYEFAKGKPLTLLNGSNLLHLLEKHGHKAKIDLKEAKKILSEQKSQQ
jgi:restriction system protein